VKKQVKKEDNFAKINSEEENCSGKHFGVENQDNQKRNLNLDENLEVSTDVTETGCSVDKNDQILNSRNSNTSTSFSSSSSAGNENLVHASASTTTTLLSFGLSSEKSFSRAKFLSEIERKSSTRYDDISKNLAENPDLNKLLIKHAKLRRVLKLKQSEFDEIDNLLQKWRKTSSIPTNYSSDEIENDCQKFPTRSSSGNSSDPNRALSPEDMTVIRKFTLNQNSSSDKQNMCKTTKSQSIKSSTSIQTATSIVSNDSEILKSNKNHECDQCPTPSQRSHDQCFHPLV